MNNCKFIRAWIGPCNKETEGKFCEEHDALRCSGCGVPAVKECSDTSTVICGVPLCNDCEHKYENYKSMGHHPKNVKFDTKGENVKRPKYHTALASEQVGYDEQLLQLTQITWDGDIIDKRMRDALVYDRMAVRYGGYTVISQMGIQRLIETKLIHP